MEATWSKSHLFRVLRLMEQHCNGGFGVKMAAEAPSTKPDTQPAIKLPTPPTPPAQHAPDILSTLRTKLPPQLKHWWPAPQPKDSQPTTPRQPQHEKGVARPYTVEELVEDWRSDLIVRVPVVAEWWIDEFVRSLHYNPGEIGEFYDAFATMTSINPDLPALLTRRYPDVVARFTEHANKARPRALPRVFGMPTDVPILAPYLLASSAARDEVRHIDREKLQRQLGGLFRYAERKAEEFEEPFEIAWALTLHHNAETTTRELDSIRVLYPQLYMDLRWQHPGLFGLTWYILNTARPSYAEYFINTQMPKLLETPGGVEAIEWRFNAHSWLPGMVKLYAPELYERYKRRKKEIEELGY